MSSLQVSAIMLGVKDVDRAKRFYAEGLGCEIDQDFPGFVRCSLGEGSSMLALYEWGQRHRTPASPRRDPGSAASRSISSQLGTCWRFTGTTTPYGRIAKAQDSYTHRLGWKLLCGPIPEGKELHHHCGVYACWNPDHLELVTHAENPKGTCARRKCSQGHPLSGANLRINPNGTRTCRACNAANQRAFRERQRSLTCPSDESQISQRRLR